MKSKLIALALMLLSCTAGAAISSRNVASEIQKTNRTTSTNQRNTVQNTSARVVASGDNSRTQDSTRTVSSRGTAQRATTSRDTSTRNANSRTATTNTTRATASRTTNTSVVSRTAVPTSNKNANTARTATNQNIVTRVATNTVANRAAKTHKTTNKIQNQTTTRSATRTASGTARARTTATSLLDTLTNKAELIEICRNQYADCMDNYCNVLDENMGRCACSKNIKNYQKTSDALKEANNALIDVAQQIQYIGLNKVQIETLFAETEAEMAMSGSNDNTKLKTSLDKIKNMVIDVKSATASSTENKAKTLDLSGLLDFKSDGTFGDIMSLFQPSDSDINSISNQRGETLRNTAHARCKKTVLDACTAQGVDSVLITNGYDIQVDKDCIAYEQNLNTQNEEMLATVRNATNVLQRARLTVAANKNSYDLRGCIAALETCMTDEYICGADYEHCLDESGEYIVAGEVVMGSEIGTFDREEIENMLKRKMFGAKTNEIQYSKDNNETFFGPCAEPLNLCQDYTYSNKRIIPDNRVISEYISRAVPRIKKKHDDVIAEFASECVSDVVECVSANNYSKDGVSSTAISACKKIIGTCKSAAGIASADNEWVLCLIKPESDGCDSLDYVESGDNNSTEKYTLTYSLNGGAGNAPSSKKCSAGKSCTLNSGATTSFYRAGYVFKGWSTSSSATSGSTSITINSDTTVYAIWQPCAAGTYKDSSEYANTSCTAASAGYYVSGTAATSQTPCSGNTYTDTTGQTSCQTCPSDTVANSNHTGCESTGGGNSGGSETPNCSAGQYLNGNSCASCPAGYRCQDNNKYKCTGNTYSTGGASSCTECGTGTSANETNTGCESTGGGNSGGSTDPDEYTTEWCEAFGHEFKAKQDTTVLLKNQFSNAKSYCQCKTTPKTIKATSSTSMRCVTKFEADDWGFNSYRIWPCTNGEPVVAQNICDDGYYISSGAYADVITYAPTGNPDYDTTIRNTSQSLIGGDYCPVTPGIDCTDSTNLNSTWGLDTKYGTHPRYCEYLETYNIYGQYDESIGQCGCPTVIDLDGNKVKLVLHNMGSAVAYCACPDDMVPLSPIDKHNYLTLDTFSNYKIMACASKSTIYKKIPLATVFMAKASCESTSVNGTYNNDSNTCTIENIEYTPIMGKHIYIKDLTNNNDVLQALRAEGLNDELEVSINSMDYAQSGMMMHISTFDTNRSIGWGRCPATGNFSGHRDPNTGECLCNDGYELIFNMNKQSKEPTCMRVISTSQQKPTVPPSSCQNGQYLNGNSCETCPAGYYCKNNIKTQCAENTYSTGGATECVSCEDMIPDDDTPYQDKLTKIEGGASCKYHYTAVEYDNQGGTFDATCELQDGATNLMCATTRSSCYFLGWEPNQFVMGIENTIASLAQNAFCQEKCECIDFVDGMQICAKGNENYTDNTCTTPQGNNTVKLPEKLNQICIGYEYNGITIIDKNGQIQSDFMGEIYSGSLDITTNATPMYQTCTCTSGTGVSKCDTYVENNRCKYDITCAGGYTTVNSTITLGVGEYQYTAQCTAAGTDSGGSETPNCPDGQYLNGTSCETCPAGYRCQDNNKYKCTGNTYSTGGASVCVFCNEGTVDENHTTCVSLALYTCAAGNYLPVNATECAKCPAGSFCEGVTNTTASSLKDQGITTCNEALSKSYYRHLDMTSDAGATSINSCYFELPAGKTLFDPDFHEDGLGTYYEIVDCADGMISDSSIVVRYNEADYYLGDNCTSCAGDTYASEDHTTCKKCPSSQSGYEEYSDYLSQVIGGYNCSYVYDNVPFADGSGTVDTVHCGYDDVNGEEKFVCYTYIDSDDGVNCADGYKFVGDAIDIDLVSMSDILNRTDICVLDTITCPAGKYLPANATTCEPCPDSHPDSDGGTGDKSTCFRTCTSDDIENATAVTDGVIYYYGNKTCTATACNANYYINIFNQQYCSSCPTTYPSSDNNNSGIAGCYRECEISDIYNNANVESVSGKRYYDSNQCQIASCATGFVISTDGSKCVPDCEDGFSLSADGSKCVPDCAANQYLSDDTCLDCPEGYTSNGGTGITSCGIACETLFEQQPDLFSDHVATVTGNAFWSSYTNKPNISSCEVTCETGFEYSGYSCIPDCAADQYWSDGTCHNCPTGFTSKQGSTGISSCEITCADLKMLNPSLFEGWTGEITGDAFAKDADGNANMLYCETTSCDAGYYFLYGECEKCPDGYTSTPGSNEGHSSCWKACSVDDINGIGAYGATAVDTNDKKYYGISANETCKITACDTDGGYTLAYNDTLGRSVCQTVCPAGQYGKTENTCQPCPEGYQDAPFGVRGIGLCHHKCDSTDISNAKTFTVNSYYPYNYSSPSLSCKVVSCEDGYTLTDNKCVQN